MARNHIPLVNRRRSAVLTVGIEELFDVRNAVSHAAANPNRPDLPSLGQGVEMPD
jgi:hypothetical protein